MIVTIQNKIVKKWDAKYTDISRKSQDLRITISAYFSPLGYKYSLSDAYYIV